MTLSSVAAEGSRLATLTELRDVLAKQIEECDSARDVAALSQRLMDVLAQIEALAPPEPKESSAADEIAKRRTARRAGSARPARAKRQG